MSEPKFKVGQSVIIATSSAGSELRGTTARIDSVKRRIVHLKLPNYTIHDLPEFSVINYNTYNSNYSYIIKMNFSMSSGTSSTITLPSNGNYTIIYNDNNRFPTSNTTVAVQSYIQTIELEFDEADLMEDTEINRLLYV